MPPFLKKIVRKMLIANPKERISFEEIYTAILKDWMEVSQLLDDPKETLTKLGTCQ